MGEVNTGGWVHPVAAVAMAKVVELVLASPPQPMVGPTAAVLLLAQAAGCCSCRRAAAAAALLLLRTPAQRCSMTASAGRLPANSGRVMSGSARGVPGPGSRRSGSPSPSQWLHGGWVVVGGWVGVGCGGGGAQVQGAGGGGGGGDWLQGEAEQPCATRQPTGRCQPQYRMSHCTPPACRPPPPPPPSCPRPRAHQ